VYIYTSIYSIYIYINRKEYQQKKLNDTLDAHDNATIVLYSHCLLVCKNATRVSIYTIYVTNILTSFTIDGI